MDNLNRPAKSCCTASRPVTGNRPEHGPDMAAGKADMKGMIGLPGGTFLMGTRDEEGFPEDGEGPLREISLDAFHIDALTVTNEQFDVFVRDTQYETDAERYGWSFVFYGLLSEKMLATHPQVAASTPWWCAIPGAAWRRPEGADSDIRDRMDHPVVHVSWNDANAYCKWAGKRLPTEAEWEYAARGGLAGKKFPWGDELTPGGEHRCNIWQGAFPGQNSLDDGFLGTAPAKSFKPNGFGLYNTSGNVWEWCRDWFSRDFHRDGPRVNPRGPEEGNAKVIRGGSFLCHHSYCNRYRVAARSSNTIDSSASNMGFRCAW